MHYPLLIDGGLSNVLENMGCDLNHKLWSAKLLESNPGAIIDAHLAYLNAGAQCIATASYQASFMGYDSLGINEKAAEKYILKSIHLAEEAINIYCKKNSIQNRPIIAASIGPYGAYLADGSEYHGNYGVTANNLVDFHKKRIELLDNSSADILAFETIPSFQETKIISKLTEKARKKSWISFSCKDEKHINDGTPIANCVELLANHPRIFAIGVNCTDPKYVSGLIKEMKPHINNKKIIVYPNSGEAYNAKSKSWLGTSDPIMFKEMAKEWLELGAELIGGCCRIGPDHINHLQEVIDNR